MSWPPERRRPLVPWWGWALLVGLGLLVGLACGVLLDPGVVHGHR